MKDPEGNEISALHAMVDLDGLTVLEVGCGEGRLTWRYAENAAYVTGIDPDGEAIEAAISDTPEGLKGRVDFLESTIEDFIDAHSDRIFDVALFSWSL